MRVREVSCEQLRAAVSERGGFGGVANQCTYLVAALEQELAEAGADKAGGAGNGDQAAVENQAEATLSRTSCVAASSLSVSLLLMKSRRALARDNLPEEVRGREWMGTSST